MNIKTFAFGCAALAASVVWAVDFPKAGGDLASAEDWGGALPGADDAVTLPNAGTYTLSSDIEFKNMAVGGAGTILSFGSKTLTLSGTFSNKTKGGLVLDSGTYDLSGAGDFWGANADHSGNSWTVITNACTVTGVKTFYAAKASTGAASVIAGGSTVSCSEVRVLNDSGNENTLKIQDGAKLTVSGNVYLEASNTKGNHGGNALLVSGAGSELHQTGSGRIRVGFQCNDDLFRVSDGGYAQANGDGVDLGYTNSMLRVDQRGVVKFPAATFLSGSKGGSIDIDTCATATITTVSFNAKSSEGRFCMAGGAVVSAPTVAVEGLANGVVVSNSEFSATTSFALGSTAAASGNTATFFGADTKLSLKTMDWFGLGRGHSISFGGGLVCTNLTDCNTLMAETQDSSLIVSGTNTILGNALRNFYVGAKGKENCSTNNLILISDGATLQACRYCLMGTGNRTVISNATLHVGNDSVGLRIGYRISGYWTTNCVLTLAGRSPKVKVDGADASCLFANSSTLRFCVPVEGYDPSVPVFETDCSFSPNSTTKIVVECDEFVEKTGGTLHLLRTGEDISASVITMLRAVELPPKCRLIVEKRNVYLKSPKRTGLMMIVR